MAVHSTPTSPPNDLGHSLRRFHIDAFQQREIAAWPVGLRVLDLGGNRIQKRGVFNIETFDLRVVYANWSIAKKPHVRADAVRLPFASCSFDALVCAELLEHVYDPRGVVAEIARVLKPGGRLLVTVPFLVHIHGDPHDFGRYTAAFWRRLLAESGFEQIQFENQGLFWTVLFDSLRVKALEWRLSGSLGWPWITLVEQAIRWGRRRAWASESGPGSREEGGNPLLCARFTAGYGILASKRNEAAPV